MICVKVVGPTLFDVKKQMNYASDYGDMVELKMDVWNRHTVKDVAEIVRDHPDLPAIFVLRPKKETSELRRFNEIESLLNLKPAFFDIEAEVPLEMRRALAGKFPQIQWIISSVLDQFDKDALIGLYEKHFIESPRAFLKVTLKAKSPLEALLFCSWLAEMKNPRLIGVVDMPGGEFARVLAPVIGSPWVYASAGEKSGSSGIVSAQTLRECYCLSKKRTINAFLVHLGSDSLPLNRLRRYNKALLEANQSVVMISIGRADLASLRQSLKELPISGMALEGSYQEEILGELDYIDPVALKVEAVNTVLCEEGSLYGFNNEGLATIEAIEKHRAITGVSIGVIGEGSDTRAAVYEAKQRGGQVTVYTRKRDIGDKLAYEFGCHSAAWGEWGEHAIWINTIPQDPGISVKKGDIVVNCAFGGVEDSFLHRVEALGATFLSGEKIFETKVPSQVYLWFRT